MKTVKQQAEVSFKLLDFADKVVMLPLMDKLSHALSSTGDLELRTDNACDVLIERQHVERIFKVLNDLGCRTSLGESYEDVIKSLDLREKTILFLKDPGQCKLEIIKIVKDQLNIGLREAKDLVNSCPVKVNLDNYSTPTAGYEYILEELIAHGATAKLTTEEQ